MNAFLENHDVAFTAVSLMLLTSLPDVWGGMAAGRHVPVSPYSARPMTAAAAAPSFGIRWL